MIKSPYALNKQLLQEMPQLSSLDDNYIFLQPISITIFDGQNIYVPCTARSIKKISYEDFLSKYADHPIRVKFCFDEAAVEKADVQKYITVTAYGFGFDGWYIAMSQGLE